LFSAASLSSPGLVVDAGANIGLFSLFCLARFDCRVVAVEASSHLCRVLARNVLGNGDVRVVHACVSDTAETSEFHYFPDMPGESTRHLHEHHEQQLLLNQAPWRHETEPVVCATLERILSTERGAIVLLKVDVEGDELAALRSLGSVWPRVRHCAVEVRDLGGRLSAVRELLADMGFELRVAAQGSSLVDGYLTTIPLELGLYYVFGCRCGVCPEFVSEKAAKRRRITPAASASST